MTDLPLSIHLRLCSSLQKGFCRSFSTKPAPLAFLCTYASHHEHGAKSGAPLSRVMTLRRPPDNSQPCAHLGRLHKRELSAYPFRLCSFLVEALEPGLFPACLPTVLPVFLAARRNAGAAGACAAAQLVAELCCLRAKALSFMCMWQLLIFAIGG